jgi:hypothetical protein
MQCCTGAKVLYSVVPGFHYDCPTDDVYEFGLTKITFQITHLIIAIGFQTSTNRRNIVVSVVSIFISINMVQIHFVAF